jgi:hypothetical protein
MSLTESDIISIIGICVNLAITIILFLIVKFWIEKVKGPRLSVFGYREEEIRSEVISEHPDGAIIDSNILPLPRWFIIIPYEILNIGDTTAKFSFHAELELNDVFDKKTKKSLIAIDRSGFSRVLKPGVYLSDHSNFFGFIFDDIDAFKWKKATIRIIGHYFDHKSNKKTIKIDPQIITNKKPMDKLDAHSISVLEEYNDQQRQLATK